VILLSLRGFRFEPLGLCSFVLLTDVVDGWVARHLDAEARFGAHLDVLADMVVILGLLSMRCVSGMLPFGIPAASAVAVANFLFSSRCSALRYDPVGGDYAAIPALNVAALAHRGAERKCSTGEGQDGREASTTPLSFTDRGGWVVSGTSSDRVCSCPPHPRLPRG